MNITTSLPPVQMGKTIANDSFKGFAMSLQGASHLRMEPPVPCQDFCDIRYLESEGLLIAAVADGLGTCRLSHWGAYTAVTAALKAVEQGLKCLAGGRSLRLDIQNEPQKAALKNLMIEAFQTAVEAVENCADQAQPPQPVFSLQSTLTVAIYDGKTLFHGHVGDDGIVVQSKDGRVVLATKRLKGEEASSVYPLQSGSKYWTFGAALGVTAFVMATDGVLDAFVTNRADYFGIHYNDGVFYGFMEDAVYKLAENTPQAAQNAMEQYKAYLLSDDYRAKVTDDLTMVCVVSNQGIREGRRPEFNVRIWRTIEEESNKARRLRLASKALPQTSFGIADGEKPAASDRSKPVEQPAHKNNDMLRLGIAGGALVLSLIIGVIVGRYVFPQVSLKEYQEAVRYQDEAAQYQSEAAQYQSEAAQYQSEIAQYQSEAAQYQSEIAQYQSEAAQYQSEIAQYQSEAAQYQSEIAQYQSEATEYQNTVARYQGDLAQKETELQQLRDKTVQLEQQLERITDTSSKPYGNDHESGASEAEGDLNPTMENTAEHGNEEVTAATAE